VRVPERVDGLALSSFLFRFVQAWAKQEGGGTEGAAEVMAGALSLVPPGTVELVEDMIDSGELPVPSQDTMGGMAGDLRRCPPRRVHSEPC